MASSRSQTSLTVRGCVPASWMSSADPHRSVSRTTSQVKPTPRPTSQVNRMGDARFQRLRLITAVMMVPTMSPRASCTDSSRWMYVIRLSLSLSVPVVITATTTRSPVFTPTLTLITTDCCHTESQRSPRSTCLHSVSSSSRCSLGSSRGPISSTCRCTRSRGWSSTF